jgi:hypothetical protein
VLVLAVFRPTVLGGRYGETWEGAGPSAGQTLQVPRGLLRRGAPVTESDWVDASREAVQQGDVRVRVTGVRVRPIDLKGTGSSRPSRDNFLVVTLGLQNKAPDRTIPYHSWASPPTVEEPPPVLRDDKGRSYPLRGPLPGKEPAAGVLPLAPAKTTEDVILFEAPAAGVEYLRLELPATAFGGPGRLRLQIPKAMIRTR